MKLINGINQCNQWMKSINEINQFNTSMTQSVKSSNGLGQRTQPMISNTDMTQWHHLPTSINEIKNEMN